MLFCFSTLKYLVPAHVCALVLNALRILHMVGKKTLAITLVKKNPSLSFSHCLFATWVLPPSLLFTLCLFAT